MPRMLSSSPGTELELCWRVQRQPPRRLRIRRLPACNRCPREYRNPQVEVLRYGPEGSTIRVLGESGPDAGDARWRR
ncbi:hypothetical protein MJ575_09665 [Klebsiella pneumoniae]|nr:hypothetical protein MJ575_09665 [Klebsiella pneumoniae]